MLSCYRTGQRSASHGQGSGRWWGSRAVSSSITFSWCLGSRSRNERFRTNLRLWETEARSSSLITALTALITVISLPASEYLPTSVPTRSGYEHVQTIREAVPSYRNNGSCRIPATMVPAEFSTMVPAEYQQQYASCLDRAHFRLSHYRLKTSGFLKSYRLHTSLCVCLILVYVKII